MPACPNCGEDNPERAKFCMNCSTPLAPRAGADWEVRKTVTVLFTDVTGSTTLGERLDPESLRHVMSRYFNRMRSVLERHGGDVEKFIGDAVMAVFGIPRVHEDDALRAVRAAWEMRSALHALNTDLEREWGVRIAVRTGVNTGEIVAGDPDAPHPLVTGDAVNVAARLEQAAQPGEILLGETTYRLVKDAVSAEALAPLALKGKEAAVPAFRLMGLLPWDRAQRRRLDSPMVGRQRELTLLRQAFERAAGERTCHLFTILGSAGVGKSRLVEEMLRAVEPLGAHLTGHCLSYGEGIAFWPLVQVVRQAAGLKDEDTAEEGREKIASVVAGEEHAAVIVDRVAQAVGLTAAEPGPEETFWAVRKLLEALSRRRPLVLVFDDIHWGEPTFLDLVDHIADWSRDSPMLVVCLARPELLDLRPAWGGGKLNATTILLEPLSQEESARLVDNLLGPHRMGDAARARLTEVAEGNPLFVEEMLAMLIDEGVLEARDGDPGAPPRQRADLSAVAVPTSIQALLAARLDRLSGEERQVMETASVPGRVFWRGAVQELAGEAVRRDLGAHLMSLSRKELIRPDRSDFLDQEAYSFRHVLIRDAAYRAIPKEARARLHERFASWLETTVGDRAREFEEILGYHLEQAFLYRSELGPADDHARALAVRAAARLSAAGRRAFARGDMPGAATLLSRAGALLPEADPARAELLPDLGAALMETGELARASAVMEEAIQLSRAAGNPRLEADAVLVRLVLQLQTDPEGKTQEAITEARRAIRVFESYGDERGLAKAWRLLGEARWMQCRFAETEDAVQRALRHAMNADDRREEAWNLYLYAASAAWGPTPVPEAIRRCEELVGSPRGHRIVEARALVTIAGLKAMQGRFEEARSLMSRGQEILGDVGLKVWAAGTAQTSGVIEMLAGDPSAAERELRRGYTILERMGETGYLSSVAAELAEALYGQGRYEEAEQFTHVSEEVAAPDDLASQVEWRGARAKVLARRGRLEEAEKLAREAVELAESTDFINMHADSLVDLAEVLRLAGRLHEGAAALGQALELYERKGNLVSADRARAVLEETSRQTVGGL